MKKKFLTKDSFFQTEGSFAISESSREYNLYASIACLSEGQARESWENAGEGNVPSGWKLLAGPIPADTQHFVLENVPGTWYHLVGLGAHDKVVLLR